MKAYFLKLYNLLLIISSSIPLCSYATDPLQPGYIAGNFSVCYNTIPSSIIGASPALGGECGGTYSYQWESSIDNNSFTPLTNGSNLNYSITIPLTQTTYFRRKVTCGSSSNYTSVLTITVVNAPNIPVLTVIEPICGDSGGKITVESPQGANYTYSLDGSNYQSSNIFLDLAQGTYNVSVNDGSGCGFSSASATITKSPFSKIIPVIEIIAPNCNDSTGSIKIIAPLNNNIKYSLDNGTFQNGIEFYSLQPGVHTIVARDSSNCLSTIKTFIIDNFSVLITAPSDDQSYIMTSVIRKEGVTNLSQIDTLIPNEINQTIGYFDGLGRPSQIIKVKSSPTYKDIIQPIAYDQYGRETKKYLAYTGTLCNNGNYHTDALEEQLSFYQNATSIASFKIAGTSKPFSESIMEASPLSRVLEQGAEGESWQITKDLNGFSTEQGHTIKKDFKTNLDGEVILWIINGTSCTGTNFYPPKELFKSVIKDENWVSSDGVIRTTEEFKDKQNHLVLKRIFNKNLQGGTDTLSTYYVYDELNNLRYVIPPGASFNSFNEGETKFKDLIYGYHYDGRRRIIEKKVPGRDWEYIVYNKRNEVVYTQDGNQRAKIPVKEWSFFKYDAFGRLILSGIVASNNTRDSLQSSINNQSVLWESKGTVHYGYTNNAKPISGMKVLIVNYYDDYNFPQATNYLYQIDSLNTQSQKTQGLLTGFNIKVLNTKDSLWTVNYYNKEGKIIQIHSQNYVGGIDVLNTKYDFVGNVIINKRVHTGRNGQTVTILNWYEYDHLGRKKRVREKIGADPVVTLAQYNYNELGQLIEKNLHSVNGVTFVQSIDYRYNIRGWLKSINQADLGADGGVRNDDTNDGFGLELKYENGPFPQYNGNISQMNWKGKVLALAIPGGQGYKFSYDALNRLSIASSLGTAGQNFSEIYQYDKMGNIKNMSRYMRGSKIDTLTYTYYNNANQLQKVDDGGTTDGFKNGTTEVNEYTYDPNGNLWTDRNSNIPTKILYNHLNLPELIGKGTTGQKMRYVYDASGRKLTRTLVGTIDSLEYDNGIQYTGGFIDFIQTEEGRAVKNGNSYLYRYTLPDHLGNLRVEMDANGAALQEQSYYPSGMTFTYSSGIYLEPSGRNEYLYNGKEIQKLTNWYDYGARFYDPAIVRWHVIDNKSEKYSSITPYAYSANNPVIFLDPDGEDIVWFNQKGDEIGRKESKTEFRTLVATGVNPNYVKGQNAFYIYSEAPMPNIIQHKGGTTTTDPIYQKYDYIIAAETYIFNHNKNNGSTPEHTNGYKIDDPSTVPDLDPTLVKSMIMQESVMGTYDRNPKDRNDSKSDIMQANVYYSSKKGDNDWGDYKLKLGLVKDGGATPLQSIRAGITILYQKGLITKNDGTTIWIGGNSWKNATLNYNGKGAKNYSNVLDMWENSIVGKPYNYINK